MVLVQAAQQAGARQDRSTNEWLEQGSQALQRVLHAGGLGW
jgi:hypothetical protein